MHITEGVAEDWKIVVQTDYDQEVVRADFSKPGESIRIILDEDADRLLDDWSFDYRIRDFQKKWSQVVAIAELRQQEHGAEIWITAEDVFNSIQLSSGTYIGRRRDGEGKV